MPGFWEWGNKSFLVIRFAQTGCFQSSGFYHRVKWKQLPSAIWFKMAMATGHSPDMLEALQNPDLCCSAAPQHIHVPLTWTFNTELWPLQALLCWIWVAKSSSAKQSPHPLYTLLATACRQTHHVPLIELSMAWWILHCLCCWAPKYIRVLPTHCGY